MPFNRPGVAASPGIGTWRITPAFWFNRSSSLWRLEGQLHFIRRDVSENFEQITRVEANIQLIPA
jgi:hypothetical protein